MANVDILHNYVINKPKHRKKIWVWSLTGSKGEWNEVKQKDYQQQNNNNKTQKC